MVVDLTNLVRAALGPAEHDTPLVSDEASWITGQAISISGGFTRG